MTRDTEDEIARLRGLFKLQSETHVEHLRGLIAQHDAEREIYGNAAQGFRERAEHAESELSKALDIIDDYSALVGGEIKGSAQVFRIQIVGCQFLERHGR